jgi:beta-lactamase class A
MIVQSDNEATNILANYMGIEEVNNRIWNLGLNKTMLGHLLCPGAQRYTKDFNPDGSNITCTDDMVSAMRHIYDRKFSKLNTDSRLLSKIIMSNTHPYYMNNERFKHSKINSKVGMISDEENGDDIHEVGIIDNHLIVSIMMNKIGQNKIKELSKNLNKKKIFSLDRFVDNLLLYDSPYKENYFYEKNNFFLTKIIILCMKATKR